jgi:hypothetical protein
MLDIQEALTASREVLVNDSLDLTIYSPISFLTITVSIKLVQL